MHLNPAEDSSISRRSFLSATSLAAVAAGLIKTSPSAHASEEKTDLDNSADFVTSVNILQGTNSSKEFSRGNTLPIVAHPFGMAHWTLQSQPGGGWFFNPNDNRIQGFRCTHQLSPWLSDYGYATFMPVSGLCDGDQARRASSYNPKDALFAPHRIELNLLRYQTSFELIPTERCALVAVKNQSNDRLGFVFDVPGDNPSLNLSTDKKSLSFASVFNASGMHGAFATHYVLTFSRAWESVVMTTPNGSHVGVLWFDSSSSELEVRIGTSFISADQAALNLTREVGTHTAQSLRTYGAYIWNTHLSRMQIEGASSHDKTTFYSCMYRALLFPRIWHEIDKDNQIVHRSAYTQKVEPGVMYADHGYWDVYRAWYPWMSVVFPERLSEILQGWVNIAKEGGWLPQFPSPGYRACMTGTLIDAVFGDAAVKGISGFDLKTAYDALKKHATTPGNPRKGYGRRGIEDYIKLGYVPADKIGQSAAETTDSAYGDYCIAQVAKALGQQEDYAFFMKRSENWRHLFDSKTGFIRGKNSDGSWVEPFDPISWGGAHVEGGPWQHRFDVAHNPEGLIEALGGKDKTVQALHEMLTMKPVFHVGSYNKEIHEMSEMAAVPFGQYAHSNQPVHHVLYLFTEAGRPDLTDYWVTRVLKELYTPTTYCGDEDTGSMAAWYLLSSAGFFAACPGKSQYTLTSPLFRKITIALPNAKPLIISRSLGRGKLKEIRLNGKRCENYKVEHRDLTQGGLLEYRYS